MPQVPRQPYCRARNARPSPLECEGTLEHKGIGESESFRVRVQNGLGLGVNGNLTSPSPDSDLVVDTESESSPDSPTLPPPGVPPLSGLFCAPPACGCGCCCAPPALLAPPAQPARAPIVPVPRILQPPQPAQLRKQICAIPVAQCLLPCRAPPCPRNNQCCCDCCCDEDYDDYKKRRKRRRKRNSEVNSLRYPLCDTGTNQEQLQSCMRLLNRRKTQCNQDVCPMRTCKPQCTSEQISRCKSKRLLLEMICANVKSKLSHSS
ncbi:hypothetical protein DdX_02863 [Ditylenchus destructor]|uniref:Uncharacterized protein n=1 Tax=Ditylenchus destructor TaxID=166010 RepID=A0AAD4NF78_9BILA|nr:hypothetical protein DdX_02863 [Ditylenchus destructor]